MSARRRRTACALAFAFLSGAPFASAQVVLDDAFQRAAGADVCLVVGTSAVVHPAASVPLATLRSGGVLVEVNLEETPLTPHASATVLGPAGEILPELLAP